MMQRRLAQASSAADRLREGEGRSAFAQRAEKQMLRESRLAPMESADFYRDAAPAAESGAMGGGGFGTASGRGGAVAGKAASAAAAPGVRYRNIDKDEEVSTQSVQIVAGQTLYKRGQQWIAANVKDVDLKKDADKIQTVERFSEEYFKLAAANTASENAVLARQQPGEELVIKIRGQIYLFR